MEMIGSQWKKLKMQLNFESFEPHLNLLGSGYLKSDMTSEINFLLKHPAKK